MTHFSPSRSLHLHRTTPLSYRWQIWLGNLSHAARNLWVIVRYAPPQDRQFWDGVWAVAWGLGMVCAGRAMFDAAPLLYQWMHSGPLHRATPKEWGWLAVLIGAWQLYALGWPARRRSHICKTACRAMLGLWVALLIGFLTCGVPTMSLVGYVYLTVRSGVTLWRILDRIKTEDDLSC